ncbi:Homeobox protein HD-10 [Astathelohania contejeani]|uniref:Homeobox protein HD-10 n=1 Tax=Astathelohania contejeani TaxID=164912 RepID=A0ABQ7HWC5_9MICR|nr:Homeobox protein HD-10 [Thelohania contejeani]
MDNTGHNYFDAFHQTPHGELKNTYYNPFIVKHRRRTSKTQLKVLEETFKTTVRPDANLRRALGEQLGMTSRAVQIWFQNRRAKVKKMCHEAMNGRQENVNTRQDFYPRRNSVSGDWGEYGVEMKPIYEDPYYDPTLMKRDYDIQPNNNNVFAMPPELQYDVNQKFVSNFPTLYEHHPRSYTMPSPSFRGYENDDYDIPMKYMSNLNDNVNDQYNSDIEYEKMNERRFNPRNYNANDYYN